MAALVAADYRPCEVLMNDLYLEKAQQAYAEIPADKIDDRVRCLYRLADAWANRSNSTQAEVLRDEAINLIRTDVSLMELSDAMRQIADHTARPGDLRHIEAVNNEINAEVISSSLMSDFIKAWLRLCNPGEAARCLAENLERDPELVQYSTEYSASLARLGRLDDAIAATELQPEYRRDGCLRDITRICMESGQTETARRLYLESWERYRSTQIKENGCAEKGIVWNTDDCQNLIRLGELELLNQAFRYVEGFMDVYPIDFWVELAQAWWDADDRSTARFLLRNFLNQSRDIDDLHTQARKYLLLATKLHELGYPRRAQILVTAAQESVDKIKVRDQRFYLYDALIRYHLEHREVHEAQVLCRQARLWMLDKKPTETSASLKGYLEGGLISFYGKAGMTEELPELVESLKQIIGDELNLAVSEAWMHAAKLRDTPQALAQAEQAIAAVPGAYWRFEMWMSLYKAEV